ncbi:thymidylate synthase [Brevibacillus formosus]|uniref:thymidylate synthase n=1 Tax=Brevibacillus formosus TaxID=54913 RepID=UPI0018CD7D8B|nr:thymidylate synthase [Brevibacillus formosus]
MNIISGKNITDVFYQGLDLAINKWDFYTKDNIFELTPALIRVESPKERCLVIPYRNNNIIQTIAETLWVLGGRNDLEYLSKYLPRASSFSDDGETWRGAYGKRLKGWFGGVNQINDVMKVLRTDEYSARGVMILFDPSEDINLKYKDVPCNNWIQLSIRDNKLNMYVTVRANDLIWGFSGINFFEWTVLQEMVANWLGLEVGEYYHFAGFLQLYKRHYERANKMLEHRLENDVYSFSYIPHVNIDIREINFDLQMNQFFNIEKKFTYPYTANSLDILREIEGLESRFLIHCAKLMLSFILLKNKQFDEFMDVFSCIEEDHYKICAMYNYLRYLDEDCELYNILVEGIKKYNLPLYKKVTN